MSMNTPIGQFLSTKNIKDFETVESIDSAQYILGMGDEVSGVGVKIATNKFPDYDKLVLKSGDTMTGDLQIKSNNPMYKIRSDFLNIRETNTPDEWYSGGRLLFLDKNGEWSGAIQQYHNQQNQMGLQINSQRLAWGEQRVASLFLYTDVTSTRNAEIITDNFKINGRIVVPMISCYVNGNSGYKIWANGYCEQWGRSRGTTITNFFRIWYAKPYAVPPTVITLAPILEVTDTGSYFARPISTGETDSFAYFMYLNNSVTTNNPEVLWRVSGILPEGTY